MRFVCDVMLGRLAKYLRILGFDAAYAKNEAFLERYRRADDRIFLTRRTGASRFARTVHIRSDAVREQLREIGSLIRPRMIQGDILSRCIECNVILIEVKKEEIESLVPEFVYHNHTRFKRCPECNRVYWEGSHAKGMKELVGEVLT